MNETPALDLATVRAKLAGRSGRQLWRSLDELAETPAFAAFVENEFPQHAQALASAVDRRLFLKLMGASFGLAGLSACTKQPEEKIVPYVKQPEQLVLGEAMFFATAVPSAGYGIGALIESHEYRPTKLEGNPAHPASLGGTDPTTQATLLGLYDPDRSQTINSAGEIRTWSAFVDTLRTALGVQRARRGAGLRILTETVTSPTLAGQLTEILAAFPEARWHQWEPFGRDGARLGAQLAFGQAVETRYDLSRASVILTLDADLFGVGPGRLRYAREVARRRRPDVAGGMSRLYAVESVPTTFGATADHRLVARESEVEAVARAVARAIGVDGVAPADAPIVRANAKWIDAVAKDLLRHRGSSVVIPGEQQPPVVHAVAHALNVTLGSDNATVVYTDPVEARPVDQGASLVQLVADMDAGRVELLLILGGNPVFTAPADARFAERLAKVALRVHLAPYADETSELCHWHVNEAHPLEAWSDVRAFDGTATVLQPMIAPLYDGRTAHDVLVALSDRPDRSSYDLVRERWLQHRFSGAFDDFWRTTLHDGVVAGTQLPPRAVSLRSAWDPGPTPAAAEGLEIVFRPDPYVGDGRFANNGWLHGAAAAAHQAHVGQRRARRARDRGTTRARERGARRPRARRTQCPGAGVGRSGARAGYGGVAGRLRPAPRWPGGERGRRRRVRAAHGRRVRPRPWTRDPADRWCPSARLYAGSPDDGGPAGGSHGDARGVPRESRLRPGDGRGSAARALDVSAGGLHRLCVGHGDRSLDLHRLQRVHARLPGGEQHPGRRQGTRWPSGREMHWIRVDRYYDGRPRRPRRSITSRSPACTARTPRARSSAR